MSKKEKSSGGRIRQKGIMPTSTHRDRDPPQTADMRTKIITEDADAPIRADDGKTSSYSADPLGRTHVVDPLGQTRALAHPVQNAKLETAAHGYVVDDA